LGDGGGGCADAAVGGGRLADQMAGDSPRRGIAAGSVALARDLWAGNRGGGGESRLGGGGRATGSSAGESRLGGGGRAAVSSAAVVCRARVGG
jgi:hypothetical protein